MHIWLDVDNPPQVQYLLPFQPAFRRVGAEVVVTARDYGITFDLLESRGIAFHPVGAAFGRSKAAKVAGVLRRTRALTALFRDEGRPDVLICASRSSALAARRMGIPSFVLGDYEWVHVAMYRLTDSYLVFPDVVDPGAFQKRGISAQRLIAYEGLKEDISFAGLDLDAIEPHSFPELTGRRLTRILYRPPAEESHYYRPESGSISQQLLSHLAAQENAVVVFAPRYPWQAEQLQGLPWRNEPIVLREAVPFLPLLKGVDLVISSGGTMVREAAYLGVPAYSIFQGRLGGVDRHLESIGRLRLVSTASDFGCIQLGEQGRRPPLDSNPRLVDEIVGLVSERVTEAGRR
jgi:hypothetical protein